MLVDDHSVALAAGQIDGLHEQGHLVVGVQVGPDLVGKGLSGHIAHGDLAGLTLEGGQGIQILLIGVDEVAGAGDGGIVLIEETVVAVGIAVGGLQDGQAVGAVLSQNAGDAGGVVVRVGLIAAGAQSLDVALAGLQTLTTTPPASPAFWLRTAPTACPS